MNAKIKAVFKATNKDVNQWRKCKTKVTFINEVANLAHIYTNFVFNSSDKTRAEIEHEKQYNSLFTNLIYYYVMKQIIKKLGANIASQVEKTAKEFTDFASSEIKVTRDKQKNVTGYVCEFTYKVTDKDGKTINRRGVVECANNVEKWFIFDVKNGKTTDKKRFIKLVEGDDYVYNTDAKHGVKSNLEGVITTIATNLGLEASDVAKLDLTALLEAKTAEQLTACFMFAIAGLPNFPAIAKKLRGLASEAEKATRAAKKTENSYIDICKDNNIAVEDFEAAFAITNDKLEAVAAVKLAKKKGYTIAKAVQVFAAL